MVNPKMPPTSNGATPDLQDLRTSAEREVREEIGTLPEVRRWVGYRPSSIIPEFTYFTFVAEVSKDTRDRLIVAPDEDEVAGIGWFKLDNLPDDLHPGLEWLRQDEALENRHDRQAQLEGSAESSQEDDRLQQPDESQDLTLDDLVAHIHITYLLVDPSSGQVTDSVSGAERSWDLSSRYERTSKPAQLLESAYSWCVQLARENPSQVQQGAEIRISGSLRVTDSSGNDYARAAVSQLGGTAETGAELDQLIADTSKDVHRLLGPTGWIHEVDTPFFGGARDLGGWGFGDIETTVNDRLSASRTPEINISSDKLSEEEERKAAKAAQDQLEVARDFLRFGEFPNQRDADPELRQVLEAITLFTGGNVKSVRSPQEFDPRRADTWISNNFRSTDGYLKRWYASTTRLDYERAHQVMRRLSAAVTPEEEAAYTVYRGMVLPKNAAESLLVQGTVFDLSDVSSWTRDSALAQDFVDNRFADLRNAGKNPDDYVSVVLVMTEPQKGSYLGKLSVYADEDEFVTGGRIETVKSSIEEGPAGEDLYVVNVRHSDSSEVTRNSQLSQDEIQSSINAELDLPIGYFRRKQNKTVESQGTQHRESAGVPQVNQEAINAWARSVASAVEAAFQQVKQTYAESDAKNTYKPGRSEESQRHHTWIHHGNDVMRQILTNLRASDVLETSVWHMLPEDLKEKGPPSERSLLDFTVSAEVVPSSWARGAMHVGMGSSGNISMYLSPSLFRTPVSTWPDQLQATLEHEVRHLSDAIYHGQGKGQQRWNKNIEVNPENGRKQHPFLRKRTDQALIQGDVFEGSLTWWKRYLAEPTEQLAWAGNVARSFERWPRNGKEFQQYLDDYEVTSTNYNEVGEKERAQHRIMTLIPEQDKKRFILMVIDALRQKARAKRPDRGERKTYAQIWRETVRIANRLPPNVLEKIAEYGFAVTGQKRRFGYTDWKDWFRNVDQERVTLELANDYNFYREVLKNLPKNSWNEYPPVSLIVRNISRHLEEIENND